MAENYRGFVLNSPGDPAPWGQRENQLFKKIVDTIIETKESIPEIPEIPETPNLNEVLEKGNDAGGLGIKNLDFIFSDKLKLPIISFSQIKAPEEGQEVATTLPYLSGFVEHSDFNGKFDLVGTRINPSDGREYPYYSKTVGAVTYYLLRFNWFWLVTENLLEPLWHEAIAYGAGGSDTPSGPYKNQPAYGETGENINCVFKDSGGKTQELYSIFGEGSIGTADVFFSRNGFNVNNELYFSRGEIGHTGYTRIVLNDHHEEEHDFACSLHIAGTQVWKAHENGTLDLPNRRMDTVYFPEEVLIYEKLQEMKLEDLSLKNVDWDGESYKEESPGVFVPDTTIGRPWSDGSIAYVLTDMSPGGSGEQSWRRLEIGNTDQILSIKNYGNQKIPYWRDLPASNYADNFYLEVEFETAQSGSLYKVGAGVGVNEAGSFKGDIVLMHGNQSGFRMIGVINSIINSTKCIVLTKGIVELNVNTAQGSIMKGRLLRFDATGDVVESGNSSPRIGISLAESSGGKVLAWIDSALSMGYQAIVGGSSNLHGSVDCRNSSIAPNDQWATNTEYEYDVEIPGASVGDTVVVSFNHQMQATLSLAGKQITMFGFVWDTTVAGHQSWAPESPKNVRINLCASSNTSIPADAQILVTVLK